MASIGDLLAPALIVVAGAVLGMMFGRRNEVDDE